MYIHSVTLRNFRNYETLTAELEPGVNLLCGDNAQGKTNFLESIFIASRLRSFRAARLQETIRTGCDQAEVKLTFSAFDREKTASIVITEGRPTTVKINGVPQKRLSEAGGQLYTVLFSPDDLMLVKEGPAGRRAFLDSAIGQLRPSYSGYWSEYQRLLLRKNRILREENTKFLPLWEEYSRKLCAIGARMMTYRVSFLEKLAPMTAAFHQEIAPGEILTMKYSTQTAQELSSGGTTEQFEALLWRHMSEHYQAELMAKKCLSGIQRDEIELNINGKSARMYASQGQTRTAALALKLGERRLIEQDTGENPVLLLDDVLSELDPGRQAYVLSQIGGGQSIITCCETEKTSGLHQGSSYHVQAGKMEKIGS